MKRSNSYNSISSDKNSSSSRTNSLFYHTCDKVFDFLSNNDDFIFKNIFKKELKKNGILEDDPRVSDVFRNINDYDNDKINKDDFIKIINSDISFLEKIFTDKLIISNFSDFCNDIDNIFNICKKNTDGKLADYIPSLAKQNPDHFGVSVCTIDGQRYNIGDSDINWCIQSCSKPITYCLALEENGSDQVHKHVGHEPSGVEFNALKLNKKGIPHNPLINSGAIMTCSLIKPDLNPSDRFDYILNQWNRLTGIHRLGFSNSVYLSERASADRNFALAYFMNENKAFPLNTDIIKVLDFYFQCCSLLINSNSLSIIAATLANGGVCPLTNERIFSPITVRNCLAIMYSSGMYDYSGEFSFKIGLPSKSGVGGGIFVVIPNKMGFCTFSPNLDSYGNSVRGVDFFNLLTKKYNFHNFDCLTSTTNLDNKIDPINRHYNNYDDFNTEDIIKFASLNDVKTLQRLMILKFDLTCSDYDYRTPLHLAASNGCDDVVLYLLKQNIYKNINPIDRWGGTPLDDAIDGNHLKCIRYLLNFNAKSERNPDFNFNEQLYNSFNVMSHSIKEDVIDVVIPHDL